jgi:hypothetical protein
MAEIAGPSPAEPIVLLGCFGRLELGIALDLPEPCLPQLGLICLIEVQ